MITPEQLRVLHASDPSDPHVLHAIRENVLRQMAHRIPARTGICGDHGRPFVVDEKGAMSSGYFIHVSESGGGFGSTCEPPRGGGYSDPVWDEPTPEVAALKEEHGRLLGQSHAYRRKCAADAAFRRRSLT